MCPRSIVGVLFDSVRRFWASLLLHEAGCEWCVLLCFINPISENRYGPGFPCVNRPQIIIWGGRILTLRLNYVTDYTGPLLSRSR